MARGKIKTENSKDRRKIFKLLEILCKNEIYVTRIIVINYEFIILTENDNGLDKAFNNITDKKLRANRSILN